MGDAISLFREGLALRTAQNMEAARARISEAASLAPQEPKFAFAHAQLEFETWRPSVHLFRNAQHLWPDNLDITRNTAGALVAEGRPDTAEKLLSRTLKTYPGWIDGHKTLATLRITNGQAAGFDRSFKYACVAEPANVALRLAWFHVAANARDWDAARKIIADGEAILGKLPGFELAKVFLASESDEASCDPNLFDPVSRISDVGLDLCQVRFWLRNGDPATAAAIAERHIGTSAERTFWPYLSTAWKVLEDSRAQWLDGDGGFVKSCDLPFSRDALQTLARTLRALHTMRAPYLEQSVRGGTQTSRQLFFNPDPAIQDVRRMVAGAVRDYCGDLPVRDERHPLLSSSLHGGIVFEGSWSVLLKQQGFHACHTHNMGWISSALYVDLPEAEEMGAAPAGWLEFGRPPPELRLEQEPMTRVEPQAGRLVLFPSTMWHGTIPFECGERLTIAFDIQRPEVGLNQAKSADH